MQLTIRVEVTPVQMEAFLFYLWGYVGPDGAELTATVCLDARQEIDRAEAMVRLARGGFPVIREAGDGTTLTGAALEG